MNDAEEIRKKRFVLILNARRHLEKPTKIISSRDPNRILQEWKLVAAMSFSPVYLLHIGWIFSNVHCGKMCIRLIALMEERSAIFRVRLSCDMDVVI
jgi:hypothetical protein